MAITDSGMPVVDPHTALTNLIEANMSSPDGVWTPVVNTNWLAFKKQKTYQICIQPLYGTTEEATLGLGTEMAKTTLWFSTITLFAPSRTNLWLMQMKFVAMMDNGTITAPAAGIEVASGNGYQFIRLSRSDESKPFRVYEPNCGPNKTDDNCIGYRADYTVEMRWEE